jgi:adenylate cyclase
VQGSLQITEPTGAVWEYELPHGISWIGRSKENDIVLNDRRVSRKHAWISSEGDNYRLVDGYIEGGVLHRSVNHVFVNGQMQPECLLQNGDQILIGESTLKFILKAPAVQTLEPVSTYGVPETVIGHAPETVERNVNFDDLPMGHTQVQISVNEIIGRRSGISLETAVATPEEIKDLRRKAKMAELLFEMSKTLGTVFELDELFARATDLIFRGTPADRVVALLAEDAGDGTSDTEQLVQIGSRTRDETISKLSQKLNTKLSVSRTITRKVMKDQVAILSQDAKTDEQFQGAESIVSQGVRSTICAPLLTQSSVHGVLYADRLDPFAAFKPDHLELISAVAAQTAVAVETIRAHERLAREEVARANYSRFMPEYVVKQLLENPDSFKLGGANQTITVMFADIRGFTSFSEHENPEKVVGLLNQYFSAMSEVIFEHGGTLDKYIGDGLMALFGAPTATPNDAANALRTAVAMQRRIVSLNEELIAAGYGTVAVGMGLHTGEATIGYIGSERRSEYTAIGDTVNLASRLESNTKGGQILISEATRQAAGDIFPLVAREPITVKNRVQPVDIFEVTWQ